MPSSACNELGQQERGHRDLIRGLTHHGVARGDGRGEFPDGYFFKDTAPTEICTLSLRDALPICASGRRVRGTWSRSGRRCCGCTARRCPGKRSEEHTSELQSLRHLVCRLLL